MLVPTSWIDLQFTVRLPASQLLQLQLHVSVGLPCLPEFHLLGRCRLTAFIEGVQILLSSPVLLSPQPLLLVSRVERGLDRGSTSRVVAQVIRVPSEVEVVLQRLVVRTLVVEVAGEVPVVHFGR